MNYSDSILENKLFNLFKQGLYYIVLSIIIILVGCLVLVYGFHFRPYNVLTNSMYPVYGAGDLVVIKPQSDYNVGDTLKFDHNGTPTLHRCVAKFEYSGTIYYICHGDNVQNLDGSDADQDWRDDVEWINNKDNIDIESMTPNEIETQLGINAQVVSENKVEGVAVTSFSRWGTYFEFIKEHNVLIIAIVISIWCVVETIQNETEIKRSLRLM